jgi:hypothetical protein
MDTKVDVYTQVFPKLLISGSSSQGLGADLPIKLDVLEEVAALTQSCLLLDLLSPN